MKRVIILLSVLLFSLGTGGTALAAEDQPESGLSKGGSMPKAEYARVKMTYNNQQFIVRMDDNPTSRDFISLLPLDLTLEDYNRTEKISRLPQKLSTSGAPDGCIPEAGDLTYYAPWGNIALFYKDFGYSRGLISLGKIESSLDELAEIKDDFKVRLELMD